MRLGGWRRWKIGAASVWEFLALVVFGVFMAAFGAFGSDRAPMTTNFLYWIPVMVGGGLIAAGVEVLLLRSATIRVRPMLRAAAQVVAMTPPIALYVMTYSWLLIGSAPPSFGHWLMQLPSVFVVDVAVVLLAALMRHALREAAPLAPAEGAPPPEIRAKLPPRLARSQLIAVSAEDHYLRIHTRAGDALVLMRFKDALAALAGADGLQTHRSWWVARRGVDHARWRKGRGELTLVNGVTAPVSEAYAKAVKAVDWG